MKSQICLILFFILCTFNSLSTKNKLRLKELIQQEATQAFCYVTSNGSVFDLNPLVKKDKDYQIRNKSGNYTIDFNVCNNALTTCNNKSSLVVYMPDKNPKACLDLSGPASIVAQYDVYNDTTLNQSYIKIILSEGDTCMSDTSLKYTTEQIIFCDANVPTLAIDNRTNIDINSCSNTLYLRSKYGKYNF